MTIVMRESSHFTLVFRIDEINLLRRLLAPDATAGEFLVSMAAMSDKTFDRAVHRGRSQFESQVVILDQTGSKLALRNWRWASKDLLRSEIRELAMAAVVGDGVHRHAFVDEVTADALSTTSVSGITLRLPKQAAKILVVAYRPQQNDYDPAQSTGLAIRF
ncbi:MAG: hypothetical protein ACKOGN_07755 [Gammaproteobacteria bacterium]